MLLLHTAGTTKIGDVRRYTVTYTPDRDRILPLPKALHLRIKNTSSLPLRAAYLHGPYTLYVSVKRAGFQPWPSDTPGTDEREGELKTKPDRAPEGGDGGVPQFEPNLKAGASFYATLPIPEDLLEGSLTQFQQAGIESTTNTRHDYEYGGDVSLDGKRHFAPQLTNKRRSVTWVIEVVSQVIFTTKATVGYEVLLARDEQSLSYAYPYGPGNARPPSSGSEDYSREIRSPSIEVRFQDTEDLWNTPPFPAFEDQINAEERSRDPEEQDEAREQRRKQRVKRKPKKVHLVILTHGMHSNTSADMLFMKEAIDEEERKAALIRRKKREQDIADGKLPADYVDEDEEQVIVRGYRDNACNTERGIKWLGRRLAKYILNLVNPAEYPPPAKQGQVKFQKKKSSTHHPHLVSRTQHCYMGSAAANAPYQITSISFLGHSLGGLVQTYAIAYIHAHYPTFFRDIKPVSFCALATPFLGLSNENPFYVKFALDFGLVGKTGQDLGLTWKAPSAFSALSGNSDKQKSSDAASKPLLRILPTGPAHEVLKMFRNRTVYSNVVNDGIVPLRTSCLLFLDWKGLGRVEKARRENGNIGGLVEWGFGQLISNHGTTNGNRSPTKQSVPTSPAPGQGFSLVNPFSSVMGRKYGSTSEVSSEEARRDSLASTGSMSTLGNNHPSTRGPSPLTSPTSLPPSNDSSNTPQIGSSAVPPIADQPGLAPQATNTTGAAELNLPPPKRSPTSTTSSALSSLLTFLRPHASSSSNPPAHPPSKKTQKIYRRSQTSTPITSPTPSFPPSRPSSPPPPPKTTLLEAANDLLNPPLPSTEFIVDPSSRPQTIFHERVYHAGDIPAAPTGVQMSVEEKIARAYHRDMSWRKVLVCVPPDAHNNVVVRREFANAYGWPVVQHVVQTHFGMSEAALTSDDEEHSRERAVLGIDNGGGATAGQDGKREGTVTAGKRDPELEVPEPCAESVRSEDIVGWGEDDWKVSDSEPEDAPGSPDARMGRPQSRDLTQVSRVYAEGDGWGRPVGLGLQTGTPVIERSLSGLRLSEDGGDIGMQRRDTLGGGEAGRRMSEAVRLLEEVRRSSSAVRKEGRGGRPESQ